LTNKATRCKADRVQLELWLFPKNPLSDEPHENLPAAVTNLEVDPFKYAMKFSDARLDHN
jgi:hypothetical protein